MGEDLARGAPAEDRADLEDPEGREDLADLEDPGGPEDSEDQGLGEGSDLRIHRVADVDAALGL